MPYHSFLGFVTNFDIWVYDLPTSDTSVDGLPLGVLKILLRMVGWTALFTTIIDMGYGKAIANVELLWRVPSYLSFAHYTVVGDVVIGFVAGTIGLVLLIQRLKVEFYGLRYAP